MQSPIWFHLPLKTIAGLQGDSEYNESERVAVQIAIYMRVEVVWLDRCFFLFVGLFVGLWTIFVNIVPQDTK